MTRNPIFALFLILLALLLGSMAVAETSSVATGPAAAAPADPHKVLGNDTCVKCHAGEQAVWAATPHAQSFDQLHRRPEARQIAQRLGIESIKHGDRCAGCHYTRQTGVAEQGAATATGSAARHGVIAGVSCESCHGPARDWLDVHHDYGGPDVTRLSESPQHRQQRIARSVQLGMRNPHNVYLVAQSCYRCHTTADEELVNVGGHPAGSGDFELVAWSQGTIHHNFVSSDGKANQPSSPHRLRLMFIAGVIADTEASLRALATATQKANFGITAAQRAARAGARLKSLAAKIDDPRLVQAADLFDSVQLKLNHQGPLVAAADELAQLGYDFAENPPRTSLETIDRFVPARSTWR